LRLARDRVNLPLVVAQFDPLLRELEGSAKYHAEAKKQRECVLNKPAAKWAASDLDGKKHSLAGYRGKVVVLDFWYRGCGWCVKAMPQVKEVCKYFQGKPVVVLGMNTDSDENDARFVADKLQLNYPTLRAKGVPEKYGVQGFPTLIVIDRDGVLRGWHAGYSPTLREELVKTIEGLLGDGK
jgi:peroxiredoxin